MNIVQVKSGKVELRKDSGTLIRTIVSSGAVFADLNADQTAGARHPAEREG